MVTTPRAGASSPRAWTSSSDRSTPMTCAEYPARPASCSRRDRAHRARYAAFGIGLDAATDPKVIEALVGAERVSLLDDGSADQWPAAAPRPPAVVLAHPAILAPRWFSPRLLAGAARVPPCVARVAHG